MFNANKLAAFSISLISCSLESSYFLYSFIQICKVS